MAQSQWKIRRKRKMVRKKRWGTMPRRRKSGWRMAARFLEPPRTWREEGHGTIGIFWRRGTPGPRPRI
jgi:hypothetical protein